MFKEEPAIFIAGEVLNNKMFAMSVSHFKEILNRLNIKMPTKQVRGKEIYEVKKAKSKGRQREAQDVKRQNRCEMKTLFALVQNFELKKIKGKNSQSSSYKIFSLGSRRTL